MKVMITGSKGQLGKEITRQLSKDTKYDLILTDIDELDITNIDSLKSFVYSQKPSIIINCAAFTAVDDCESKVDLAYKANAIGPRNLAIVSNELDASIVHISTDYVFNGDGITDKDEKLVPYTEFDLPDPKTVYGKTKYEGEKFVRIHNPRHFIIRTAWLYGEGNNFVRTMLNLSSSREFVKVVNDQHGSPTSTVGLSGMISYLIGTDNYGLFHGTCEGQCTWYEFTKEIYRLAGVDTKVIPVTSEEFPRPAKRPKYSVLDNYMLKLTSGYIFKDWKEEIADYIQQNKGVLL